MKLKNLGICFGGRNGKLTWLSSVKNWQPRQNKEKLVQHYVQNSKSKIQIQCWTNNVWELYFLPWELEGKAARKVLIKGICILQPYSLACSSWSIYSTTSNQMLPLTAALKRTLVGFVVSWQVEKICQANNIIITFQKLNKNVWMFIF
jgi:hypothetical protein